MPQDMSFIQLGTASAVEPSTNQTEQNNDEHQVIPMSAANDAPDHFIERDGLTFAGTHLIIDLWGASRLDELDHIEETLKECVRVAKATLLHIHLHHFTPNGGVSGVAVLAESHISIHTWPERDYAALDIFMCGDSEPHKAIQVLKDAFGPTSIQLGDHKRGLTG